MSQSSRAFASAAVAWQTTIWPFNFIIKFHLSSVEAGGRRIRLYAVLFNLLTTTTITTKNIYKAISGAICVGLDNGGGGSGLPQGYVYKQGDKVIL